MLPSLPAPPGDLDPDHITQMASAFMSAKVLCVASELGLFEKLAGGPLKLDELSGATGLPRRSVRVLANGFRVLEHGPLAGMTSLLVCEAIS